MKIIHIIFAMNAGGSENMLVDILNEQIKQHDVELFIINKEYNQNLLNKINPDISIKMFDRKKNSRNVLPLIKLNLCVLKQKPDIIHFHDPKGIQCILPTNKTLKILTIHTLKEPINNLKKYDILCSISKAVQYDIYKRSGLKSHLVYNGIDFSKIKKKEQSIKEKKIRFLQIGRLAHEIKGQDILIKAVQVVKERKPELEISVDFIGVGPSLEYLLQLSEETGLENQINFLGLQQREYIYENLHNYDLLVQPSIYEGFGLTVIEGIAACIPVLVSNNDGPIEIIQNGKYGFFFEKNDFQDCAEKIIKIIESNGEDINDLTQKAYTYAYENFYVKRTAQHYIECYKIKNS